MEDEIELEEISEIVDEVEEEVVVSIGEEEPQQEEQTHAPEWVRELRKTNRELQRQNRELQGRLQAAPPESKTVAIGNKPRLEDHDYDAEKYEDALTNWFERKRKNDDVNAKQEAEVIDQQKAWQSKLNGYDKAKAELKKHSSRYRQLLSKALSYRVQIILRWLFMHLAKTRKRLRNCAILKTLSSSPLP